ncbi:LOW QUALITY PROTEIN: hypothetical protein Tsubulata_049804, partial [Turnera subulata]
EQNMVKQSIGFNWEAGAVSTSVWRGVPLHLVLKRCGILSRSRGALNVCFKGAEDLPRGGGSKYGTSITKEIIVTTKESDNYYHYNDNRPEYIINEPNINSAITTPSHEEILPVNSWTTQRPYTLKGYAYSGDDDQLLVSHKNKCMQSDTRIGIVFEHPTVPGNQSGGWMAKERHLEKSVDNSQTLKKSVSTPFMNTASSKTFSMAEVKKHNSPDSAWIIVLGHNLTPFTLIIKAKKMLESYRIGDCAANFAHLDPIKEVVPAASSIALVPGEKIPCKLVKKKESLSHDVRLFRFALPSEDQVLGLPVGKHIFLCAVVDEKLCMRAYTPTSTVDVVGYFDLVIKNGGGLMSQHLDSLELGSFIDVKGPLGHIEYVGRGNFLDPEDQTEMYVVYENRTEDDILLRREELDSWAKEHERLKVWYVVQASVKEGWQAIQYCGIHYREYPEGTRPRRIRRYSSLGLWAPTHDSVRGPTKSGENEL